MIASTDPRVQLHVEAIDLSRALALAARNLVEQVSKTGGSTHLALSLVVELHLELERNATELAALLRGQ